jgi:SAM-dependent methyltransferase
MTGGICGRGNSDTLVDVARRLFPNRGSSSKSDDVYQLYERYFDKFRDKNIVLFEIGVYEGESTKIFSRYFRNGTIIGVDLLPQAIDLSGFPNVVMRQGEQSDRGLLTNLANEFAPDGIDIVIDDASHVGYLSLKTFEILFGRLKPGGLYVVEDWGTGYWNDWPDGGAYQQNAPVVYHDEFPKRIVSHEFGMVGLVKHLVDHVGRRDIRPSRISDKRSVETSTALHIFPGTAILERSV